MHESSTTILLNSGWMTIILAVLGTVIRQFKCSFRYYDFAVVKILLHNDKCSSTFISTYYVLNSKYRVKLGVDFF